MCPGVRNSTNNSLVFAYFAHFISHYSWLCCWYRHISAKNIHVANQEEALYYCFYASWGAIPKQWLPQSEESQIKTIFDLSVEMDQGGDIDIQGSSILLYKMLFCILQIYFCILFLAVSSLGHSRFNAINVLEYGQHDSIFCQRQSWWGQ